MRYNPYLHSKLEAEYITKKNNPNTFNNVFSRDIRDTMLLKKLQQYEKEVVDKIEPNQYKMVKNRAEILGMVNRQSQDSITKSKGLVPPSSDYNRIRGSQVDVRGDNGQVSVRQNPEEFGGRGQDYQPVRGDVSYPKDPLWSQKLAYDNSRELYNRGSLLSKFGCKRLKNRIHSMLFLFWWGFLQKYRQSLILYFLASLQHDQRGENSSRSQPARPIYSNTPDRVINRPPPTNRSARKSALPSINRPRMIDTQAQTIHL